MIAYGLFMLVMLLIPELLLASDLGPLADLSWIGTTIPGIGYILGGGNVVWAGYKAAGAYGNREEEGMGKVWAWIFVAGIGGLVLGKVIPGLVAPIMARGATL